MHQLCISLISIPSIQHITTVAKKPINLSFLSALVKRYRGCYNVKTCCVLFLTLCFRLDSLVIHSKKDIEAFCGRK